LTIEQNATKYGVGLLHQSHTTHVLSIGCWTKKWLPLHAWCGCGIFIVVEGHGCYHG
jgi:hypothetical protein